MSWFKNSDIVSAPVNTRCSAVALAVPGETTFASGEDLETIRATIGQLPFSGSVFFMTNGAWSNIRLIEYLLEYTGPADIYFSTWSLSSDAIRRFVSWRESLYINRIVAVLDEGIRNRKPEIYQQAIAAFPELKFAKCHAKVAVLMGAQRCFTLIGSANFTRNPRRETGVIITDPGVAEANALWIEQEVLNVL